MVIVPFTPQDQYATAAFMRNIYQEMGWYEQPEDGLEDLAAFFGKYKDGKLFVIKEKEEVFGTGGFVRLNEKDILLKRFFIAKEMRGSGIASKLLDYLMEKIRNLPAERVVLDVSRNNAQAVHFYEKNGFKKYDQKPAEKWYESKHPQTYYYLFFAILQ